MRKGEGGEGVEAVRGAGTMTKALVGREGVEVTGKPRNESSELSMARATPEMARSAISVFEVRMVADTVMEAGAMSSSTSVSRTPAPAAFASFDL